MRDPARSRKVAARKERPGLLERWFFRPASPVVGAGATHRYVDPWFGEPQTPVKAPIPARRTVKD